MRRAIASGFLWCVDRLCERCHHFTITRDGYPGCLATWPGVRWLYACALSVAHPFPMTASSTRWQCHRVRFERDA